MHAKEIATQIANRFAGRWHRGYARGKLRSDPLYAGVFAELDNTRLPLLDLGCGIGILAFYLRERGLDFPIFGIDYDDAKITAADTANTCADIEFRHADARTGIPEFSGNVAILDILQFFTASQQAELLATAAARLAPGGKLIIRSCLKDRGWRFKITLLGDLFAKATSWMRSAPIHYPTHKSLTDTLEAAGLRGTLRPLWGKTPFNNYLAVFSAAPEHPAEPI